MQIDAALLWWRGNRELAPGLLARELDAALGQLAYFPQAGRRVRLGGQSEARHLLLRRCSYHIYYVIADDEVRIVYFRHARRRPGR